MPLFSIRREDYRNLAVGFVSLLVIMTAHAILETARDALFLASLPATELPWAYLAIAVLATIALRLQQRLLPNVRDRRVLLSICLLASALVTLGFWFLINSIGPWSLLAFYAWTGLLITVVLIQYWLLLADSVTVTQAKRIFPPIAAGGVVGAILGAFISDVLLRVIDPHGLLLAGATVLAVGAVTPFLWKTQGGSTHAFDTLDTEEHFSIRWLLKDNYLAKLLVLVLIGTVTLTVVDYVFKSVVADYIGAAELGTFFARFYLGLNSIALVIQLVGAGWMLRTFGVHRSAAALPLLLFAGVLGLVVGPVLIGVIVLKTMDGSLRHSLYRTAVEVLYLPLGSARRERAKSLIEGFGQRGGQALGSLLILGAVAVGLSTTQIGYTLLLPIGLWLLAIFKTQEQYAELFRSRLREGAVETRLELEELDLHSLEALLGALNSPHDKEVLAAIDLFDTHGKTHLLPVLVLYHPSKDVRLRALEGFAEARDPRFARIAHWMLKDEDCEVRAAALRALTVVEPDRTLLTERLRDEAPIVEATALIGLMSLRDTGDDDLHLRNELAEQVRNGSSETRAALARAIRHQRESMFHDTLIELAKAPDDMVRLESTRAMADNPDPAYLPYLLPCLGQPSLRSAARDAIVAIGPIALEYLDAAMDDETVPRKVRRHLPRTISRFDTVRAAKILLKHLEKEQDGAVRFKILRGLGRLRASHPSMRLDHKLLERQLHQILARAIQILRWRVALETRSVPETASGELLRLTLHEKESSTLERAFRLLGLLHPAEDFALVWRGLGSHNARVRAASREVLEATLSGRIRDAVLALVDDAAPTTRAELAASALGIATPPVTYEEALRAMLEDRSEPVRCITAHQIAELSMHSLTAELERAWPAEKGLVRDAIQRALQILREGAPQQEVGSVA
ncbi:MAG: hypothetical protein OEQ49_04695 [Myxococcales bacterium]|nr:hypothetical protein [Myxococcales bacterium]